MTNCDICGKREASAVALVEGAKLNVCHFCSKHGKIIHRLTADDKEAPEYETKRAPMQETEEIVENYSEIVRKKRQELGLPREVLAERISEKESYIEKIEKGKLMPTMSVAKKLEKELGIKLIEKVQPSIAGSVEKSGSFKGQTLADLLEDQKKKGK